MVTRVLRPLAVFLIRRNLPLAWLIEEMKQAYVVEAIREIEKGNKVTTSRISLMTGIHRNEVKRIRESSEPKVLKTQHPVSTMVALWKGELVDSSGSPLPLGRAEPLNAGSRSFFEVADHSTNRDIAPSTFLTECIHKEIVQYDEETDTVYLLDAALEPSQNLEDQMHFFARNEGDHLEAGIRNMLEDPAPFFDRSVMYRRLTEEDARNLEQLARKVAMQAILEVNQEAQRRASSGRLGKFKFNFGSFVFFGPIDD